VSHSFETVHCDDCGRDYCRTVDDGVNRHEWTCDKRLAMQRRIVELEWRLMLAELMVLPEEEA
jgi:hypothetical protein